MSALALSPSRGSRKAEQEDHGLGVEGCFATSRDMHVLASIPQRWPSIIETQTQR